MEISGAKMNFCCGVQLYSSCFSSEHVLNSKVSNPAVNYGDLCDISNPEHPLDCKMFTILVVIPS